MAADLPDEAIAEILARLPARCIARSRAVCKAWNAISSLPVVDRALAARTAAVTTITNDNGDGWLPGPRPFDDVVAVRFDRFRGRWHPAVHTTDPCPRGFSLRPDDMAVSAVGFRSWDGVLCTRAFESAMAVIMKFIADPSLVVPGAPPPARAGQSYVLWNPLTNACAVVPVPAAGNGHGHGRLIGGYAHPVTGRFHLLHADDVAVAGEQQDLFSPVTVRILRVGDDTAGWREVPLLPKVRTIAAMKGEGDPVSLHGNLHWLVRPAVSGTAAVLVFDTAREEFRLMAAPPQRPGLDPTTAWLHLVPAAGGGDGGKLCVLALTRQQAAPAMEVWVLDDYSDPWRTWRLRETITAGAGVDLSSPARFAAVEVVEGAREGEEVLIHRHEHGGAIDAYSPRRRAWRRVFAGRCCAAVLVHRDSVVPPAVSFGREAALRGFRRGWVRGCRLEWKVWYRYRRNAADIPLDWYDVKRVQGAYVVVPTPPRYQRLAPPLPEPKPDPTAPVAPPEPATDPEPDWTAPVEPSETTANLPGSRRGRTVWPFVAITALLFIGILKCSTRQSVGDDGVGCDGLLLALFSSRS